METKYSILLIDDSYIDRLVTRMLIINTFGVTDIHEATGGKTGLQMLASQAVGKDKEVLILLDIRMPEMTGFEFLDEFEKLDSAIQKNVHVIMLSSTLDPEDIELAEKHRVV